MVVWRGKAVSGWNYPARIKRAWLLQVVLGGGTCGEDQGFAILPGFPCMLNLPICFRSTE